MKVQDFIQTTPKASPKAVTKLHAIVMDMVIGLVRQGASPDIAAPVSGGRSVHTGPHRGTWGTGGPTRIVLCVRGG